MKSKGASNKEKECLECCKQVALAKDMFACTGCNDSSFCGRECQRNAWPTHRFDCLPCRICGKRIPDVKVTRTCECTKKEGYAHVDCLVKAAVEDSGGEEWSHSSSLWEQCKRCEKPFSGDVKEKLGEERNRRITLAKENLSALVEMCRDVLCNPNDPLVSNGSFVGIPQECISVYRELYGEEDWSSDDIFYAYRALGQSLSFSERIDEAVDIMELVHTKLMTNKTKEWKYHVRYSLMKLVSLYMNKHMLETQGKALMHKKSLPFLEELLDKHFQWMDDEQSFMCRQYLATCYSYEHEPKKALDMIGKACKQAEEMYGLDAETTMAVKALRAQMVSNVYVYAESHGMEELPDGTMLEIEACLDGANGDLFRVAVKSSTIPEKGCSRDTFIVPATEVVMVTDSEVVLHSLKGAKHLNGKLGVIKEFNHELGRYKVIVEGSSKMVNVKPENLIPAHMGFEKETMIELAKDFSDRQS